MREDTPVYVIALKRGVDSSKMSAAIQTLASAGLDAKTDTNPRRAFVKGARTMSEITKLLAQSAMYFRIENLTSHKS